MSGKHIAKEQPNSFIFSEINLKKKDEILKKYPEQRKKSAVMPLLYLAQKQNDGWIPLAGIQYIADLLEVPYIKVFEVATFYTMYNLAPVGKYFVQVCTTTPCMIRGSGKIVDMCKKYISEKEGHLSEDKKSSWIEVELKCGSVSVTTVCAPCWCFFWSIPSQTVAWVLTIRPRPRFTACTQQPSTSSRSQAAGSLIG